MIKILYLDLETAPKEAYIWSMWKENISLEQLKSKGFVLCWSAKWHHSNKVMSDALTDTEVKAEDDSRIAKSLHALVDDADIIIAHNGDRFDIPVMNTSFLFAGLQPPSKYKTIDTLMIARKNFKFASNRLDALGKFLNLGRKVPTGGFKLWTSVLNCTPGAMTSMVKYNKQDVVLLQQIYEKLRAWDKGHPNVTMYLDGTIRRCNVCASPSVHKKGLFVTNAKQYQRFKCTKCGHEMRSPYQEKDRTRDSNRMVSI